MHVSSITLNNFRNYEKQNIQFINGTNIFCGDNAQGKTNILEAVYLFCRGKGIRAKQDTELIKFGSDFFRIEMDFFGGGRKFNGVFVVDKSGKKSIKINNVTITRLSTLMSYFNVVFFTPEDLGLVKGAPSQRRRFIDSALSQLYTGYLTSLITYNRTLMQKNSLLKEMRRAGKYEDPTLEIWNSALASEGIKIMNYRLEFVKILNRIAAAIQEDISGEMLKIRYNSGINIKDFTYNEYLEYLNSHASGEIEFGAAKFGIQRDDIDILINDKDVRMYASQGQQRTTALALKIAQADYINEIKEEYPVLLLDDIMSELDINRRKYLWNKIMDKQVLITCTDTDMIEAADNAKLFTVYAGTVKGG